MAQEREAPEAVIQSRLLKILQVLRRLDKTSAAWCRDRAIPQDLRTAADKIDEVAKS